MNINILHVLSKYGYPISNKTDFKCKTVAKWRGGVKYNVDVNIRNNFFYDYVTKENGNSFDLFCLINDLECNNESYIKYLSEMKSYSSYTEVDDYGKENFDSNKNSNSNKKNTVEIEEIYNSLNLLYCDKYFKNKGIDIINHKSSLIRQVKISQRIINETSKEWFVNNNYSNNFFYEIAKNKSLVIPIYSIIDFSLINLQFIHEDGSKLFLKDASMKNPFFPVYSDNGLLNLLDNEYIILCEGVATGFSVYDIINGVVSGSYSIISCITASGLEDVADQLLLLGKKVIIFSDFDSNIKMQNKIYLGAHLKYIKKYIFCENVTIITPFNEYIKTENDMNDIYNNISDFNDLYLMFDKNINFCRHLLFKKSSSCSFINNNLFIDVNIKSSLETKKDLSILDKISELSFVYFN